MRAAAAGPISFPHRGTKSLVYLLLSRDVFSRDYHHYHYDYDDEDQDIIFNMNKLRIKNPSIKLNGHSIPLIAISANDYDVNDYIQDDDTCQISGQKWKFYHLYN